MAHSRRRERYANPSQRIRFGSMRYIPPFSAVVSPDVPPGGQKTILLPAGPATYYIQWTINVDGNAAAPQDWGHAQLHNTANTQIYDYQFNDRVNSTIFYIVNGSVDFSTGIAAQNGDKGTLTWSVATASLNFHLYHNGVVVPGASFNENGVPVFDHVVFAAGVESITGIIVQPSAPANPPL